MALSYLTDGEAPRDFRVSSTDSDGHYTKCLLCYSLKKNFFCVECISTGSFVHSSMPYSDSFSEKQMKLLRLKANRKHVLDRCEKLLSGKLKKDKLLTEAKQSRDRIGLLRLAIEQRRNNIVEKRKELEELKKSNNELRLKLPRYEKRVASLGKHAEMQNIDLHNKIGIYTEKAQTLAALRRSRIRQLTTYIFPLYITYDTSDSIEDLEFLGDDIVEEPQKRQQLHIVAPWVHADAEFNEIQNLLRDTKCDPQSAGGGAAAAGAAGGGAGAAARTAAALAHAAQLTALLAWTLDVRLPHTLSLDEYWCGRVCAGGAGGAARLAAGCTALCARAAVPAPPRALPALYELAVAAQADSPPIGRVEGYMSSAAAAVAVDAPPDDAEPEHLSWPDHADLEESPSSATPPAHASLVTSAAASLASMWRGWTNPAPLPRKLTSSPSSCNMLDEYIE